MGRVRVALCQLDTVVGDVDGNVSRVIEALQVANEAGCDIAAFPELSLTGYPPEDLLLKPAFVSANLAGLERVTAATTDCVALVGFVDLVGARIGHPDQGLGRAGREEAVRGDSRRLRNAAAVCVNGRVAGVYHKRRLPNYAVFDEERWFAPGTGDLLAVEVAGVTVGISICEDLWFPGGPIADLGAGGAQLIVNLNASPYSIGRRNERLVVLAERIAEAGCAICYVNQVGGQDELVFDGGSVVVDRAGSIIAEAAQFSEEILVTDIEVPDEPRPNRSGSVKVVKLRSTNRDPAPLPARDLPATLEPDAEVYEALRVGTRDYLRKNGFTDAVIGLSGGIDSSLVAAVAVDAIGAEHVHGIAMPSRYSSEGSITDADELARNLGMDLQVVPIEEAHLAFGDLLGHAMGDAPAGLTDENLQSRIRGVILMAFSNAHPGWIVLTTGNKSELATGYSTLYGDSAGGFAVIKDVPKTIVYRLCEYRNALAKRDLIPRSVLDKPPSAELRPDQRDDQSLPPYDVLDPVLAGVVEQDESVADLVATGVDADLAARVAQLVDAAEYKRRQSPPGVRITVRAFGKDRRMPITNRFREGRPSSAATPESASPESVSPESMSSESMSPESMSPESMTPETMTPETGTPDTISRAAGGKLTDDTSALVSSPWDDPLTGSSPDALSLIDSARMIGGYRWVEFRMFEVLGGWVTNESQPEARLMFDVQSRHHAWHAQLWADRLPSVDGIVDPDEMSVAPGPGTEELFLTLGGVRGGEPGGGGTLLRLVGLARVVLPRLACGYAQHLRRAVSVSDSAVVRALRLTLRDETEAWQTTEGMVQSLIRRPHDVEVVTAHQQRLEALVAGTGPGLVPWSGETSP